MTEHTVLNRVTQQRKIGFLRSTAGGKKTVDVGHGHEFPRDNSGRGGRGVGLRRGEFLPNSAMLIGGLL